MSQSTKSALYRVLKDSGVQLERHYRDYTTEDLRTLCDVNGLAAPEPEPARDAPPAPKDEIAEIREQLSGVAELVSQLAAVVTRNVAPAAPQQPAQPQQPPLAQQPPPAPPTPKPTVGNLDPAEHAGVTLNTHTGDDVIRVDEFGNQWYQNEVNKPGYPKPRGRRVLREMDPGTVTETIQVAGGYTETFEIPGDPKFAKPIEVKVTLPSYQTGIYKAPGMPFKIHIYQGNRGFDYDDVNRFYGGADLVPDSIKKTYVSSDLCYDMTTTIRAIQDEYRERVLKKEALR